MDSDLDMVKQLFDIRGIEYEVEQTCDNSSHPARATLLTASGVAFYFERGNLKTVKKS